MGLFKHTGLLSFLVLVLSGTLIAQSYQLDPENSDITIEGTSTLHNWHADASQMSGSANFIFMDGQLKDIKEMNIAVSAESLESGKSAMNKNMYGALKTDEFPKLKYILTRIEEIKDDKIICVGLLTVAGVTREVTTNVAFAETGSQDLEFEGNLELKMTDFNIEPPTAMLGTLKTGDAITILFNLRFKQ